MALLPGDTSRFLDQRFFNAVASSAAPSFRSGQLWRDMALVQIALDALDIGHAEQAFGA